MAEYIERDAVHDLVRSLTKYALASPGNTGHRVTVDADDVDFGVDKIPAADVAQVRHGRWILEAHDERVNYRWNVTAECSECCDEKREIWAGFFPNVPDWLARDVALESAKSVKLSNYCPNCGAKMDLEAT